MIKIIFKDSNDTHEHFASANFIVAGGRQYLATAAHCFFNPVSHEMAKDIRIETTIDGKPVYGNVTAVKIDSHWKNGGALQYDNAFCSFSFVEEIDPNCSDSLFDYLPKENDFLSVEGISSGLFFNKRKKSVGHPDLSLLNSNWIIGIPAKMKQGVSGGPVFAKVNGIDKQVGVISASFKETPNYVWCTVWNRDTYNLITSL
ncbi:trypsin-like serine peptidase [Lactiplantibacillus plantarum]|uniref:trypsin-like serine peptidase n=1 Tax=Lactiplantibacillus plantarum TaxID=1590 RepID=UPI003C285313